MQLNSSYITLYLTFYTGERENTSYIVIVRYLILHCLKLQT